MMESPIVRTALLTAGTAVGIAASQPSLAQETVETQAGDVAVQTVTDGLDYPWGLAFLPDGRMLVTELSGSLRIVGADGQVSDPIAGVPEVYAEDQGGVLDVALAPDFEESNLVYLSFSEPGGEGASTAVARGRLAENGLQDVEVVFRQEPKIDGGKHFGSRLAFAPDGKLFVTTGERFTFGGAQEVENHLGTVVRINPDGSVPQDNPFVGQENARPEIWSYGHRNIEAAAIHPETDALWIAEMGPEGGDELNLPRPGENYGWPLVSWGEHYDGTDIPDPPTRPDFVAPIHHWTPVISPSGMAFYTGELFAEWQGDLLIGGLSSEGLVHLTLDGETVADDERISLDARIRDVAQGPDGAVYVVTDEGDGRILRLAPAES